MGYILQPADELYTQVWFRMTALWSSVLTFRQIAELGLPHATPRIYNQNVRFAQSMFTDPEHDKLFLDKQKVIDGFGGAAGLGAKMTETMSKAFRSSVDAASVVFAHSLLDGAAIDFCRVTALAAPDDWEPFIKDRKVALSEIKGQDYAALLNQRLNSHLEHLERQALIMKTDRLFALCKLPNGFTIKTTYRFDRERLVKLDELRHELIHGEGALDPVPSVDDSIKYLFETALFLFAMVNNHYGVRIDPYYPTRAGWR